MKSSEIRLIGNVGKIENSYTPQGKYVVKGTLAVSQGKGDKKETVWFNFIAWEKTGEWLFGAAAVGTRLMIVGEFRVRKWETEKSSGTNLDVTVSEFLVLSKGKERTETPQEDEELPGFMQD